MTKITKYLNIISQIQVLTSPLVVGIASYLLSLILAVVGLLTPRYVTIIGALFIFSYFYDKKIKSITGSDILNKILDSHDIELLANGRFDKSILKFKY